MVEAISLVVGLVIGSVATIPPIYYFLRSRKQRSIERPKETILRPTSVTSSIRGQEFEKAKRDSRTLLLEKDMLAGALTRVYEAEADGTITKDERDRLASKYRGQIKAVDEKLASVEIVVEVGELERLRQELLAMFDQKVGQIEARLREAKNRMGHIKVMTKLEQPEEKPPMEEEKRIEKKKIKEESPVDKKVNELREEVLEALARLEQIDLEG